MWVFLRLIVMSDICTGKDKKIRTRLGLLKILAHGTVNVSVEKTPLNGSV